MTFGSCWFDSSPGHLPFRGKSLPTPEISTTCECPLSLWGDWRGKTQDNHCQPKTGFRHLFGHPSAPIWAPLDICRRRRSRSFSDCWRLNCSDRNPASSQRLGSYPPGQGVYSVAGSYPANHAASPGLQPAESPRSGQLCAAGMPQRVYVNLSAQIINSRYTGSSKIPDLTFSLTIDVTRRNIKRDLRKTAVLILSGGDSFYVWRRFCNKICAEPGLFAGAASYQ